MTNRLIFSEDDARFSDEVRLSGLGGRERMPPGHVGRRNGLPAFLIVLFHGAVEIELQGQRRRLPANSLVAWDRDRPHWFGHAQRSWNHSWVVFDGAIWRRGARQFAPFYERPVTLGSDPGIGGYFFNLLREFSLFTKPDLRIIAGIVDLLLGEIRRSSEQEAWLDAISDPVETACRWIREHLAEPMPVAAIARAASLSPSRLQQLFRARRGVSVQQFVEWQRLQEARYWLMHSGQRIGEIATRIGYSDAFYFSRRFRRAFGESPARHRARQHESKPQDIPRQN